MPVASTSGTQAAGGALWAQIQQQQAQRTADQAEQRANVLQSQAREALGEASRAQEKARTLQVESDSARSDAGEARRNIVAQRSVNTIQTKLDDLQGQIARVLESPSLSASQNSAPVVNASGQQTGTVINVTA